MTLKKQVKSLSKLSLLREMEVDQLTIEMANKEVMRQRYQRNLALMDSLCVGAGASGALPLALSTNCANYKQALFKMKASHQQDLTHHEAKMAVVRDTLRDATVRQASLDFLIERKQGQLSDHAVKRQQKHQDELASQVWQRRRHGLHI